MFLHQVRLKQNTSSSNFKNLFFRLNKFLIIIFSIFAMVFVQHFIFLELLHSFNFFVVVDIRNVSLLHHAPFKHHAPCFIHHAPSQTTDSSVSCIIVCSLPGPQVWGSFHSVTAPTFIRASLVPPLLLCAVPLSLLFYPLVSSHIPFIFKMVIRRIIFALRLKVYSLKI